MRCECRSPTQEKEQQGYLGENWNKNGDKVYYGPIPIIPLHIGHKPTKIWQMLHARHYMQLPAIIMQHLHVPMCAVKVYLLI